MDEDQKNLPPASEVKPAAKIPLSASGRITLIALVVTVVIVVVAIVWSAFGTIRNNQIAAKNNTGLMQAPSPITHEGMVGYDASVVNQQLEAAEATKKDQMAALAKACQDKGGVVQYDATGTPACQLPETLPDITPAQQEAVKHEQKSGGTSKKDTAAALMASDMLVLDLSAGKGGPVAPVATDTSSAPSDAAKAAPAAKDVAETDDEDEDTKTGKHFYDFAKSHGKTHIIFEGTVLETILRNRIDGEFPSPIEVMLTTDLYSHNRQELLVPRGTILIGSVRKIGNQFQRRLATSFHRAIMPDGFPLDLDKFTGLDQQGSAGLAGKVNHHYMTMFGMSVALGAISGLTQIGNSTNGLGYSPTASIRNGMGQAIGQEAVEVLNRFTQIPPTITIPEGSRVRVWISQDLTDVPAYANHDVPDNL